jgi:hypothetical protein
VVEVVVAVEVFVVVEVGVVMEVKVVVMVIEQGCEGCDDEGPVFLAALEGF